MDRTMRRLNWVAGCGVCAFLFVACDFVSPLTAAPTAPPKSTRVAAPDPSIFSLFDRSKGNPDAKVTLVVYSDFQCSYCKQFALDAGRRLDDEFVKTGKINFTFKYFPLLDGDRIGESHWAAFAAECANEQGKFWEYHDRLFALFREKNTGAFTKDKLKTYAAGAGLDLGKFDACLDTEKYAGLVLDQHTEALQLQLSGAPSFLINGRRMNNHTLDYAEFREAIETELNRLK
jgi:protein-disulfide isomerase